MKQNVIILHTHILQHLVGHLVRGPRERASRARASRVWTSRARTSCAMATRSQTNAHTLRLLCAEPMYMDFSANLYLGR